MSSFVISNSFDEIEKKLEKKFFWSQLYTQPIASAQGSGQDWMN